MSVGSWSRGSSACWIKDNHCKTSRYLVANDNVMVYYKEKSIRMPDPHFLNSENDALAITLTQNMQEYRPATLQIRALFILFFVHAVLLFEHSFICSTNFLCVLQLLPLVV